MASCKHINAASPEQLFCCILVVFFPPNAIVPFVFPACFPEMCSGLEGRKVFHANAMFSQLSIRGTTNDQDEAYVGIEVGLGNLVSTTSQIKSLEAECKHLTGDTPPCNGVLIAFGRRFVGDPHSQETIPRGRSC